MTLDDAPESLLLAGYSALSEHGFALPCYASHPLANTWRTAVTEVPGDRAATIVGFAEYAGDNVTRLAEDQIRKVSLGDRWLDVFLWQGQVLVGEPSGLLLEMGDLKPEIEALSPVSFFDFVAEVPSERHASALAAGEYLAQRHGKDIALQWRVSVLRSAIQRRVRRLLPEVRHNDELLAEIALTQISERIRIVLPDEISSKLLPHPDFATWRSEIDGFALDLDLGAPEIFVEPISELDPRNIEQEGESTQPPTNTIELLILTTGPRSSEIARLARHSDWRPWWTSQPAAGGRGPFQTDVTVRSSLPDDQSPADWDAIIILLDDNLEAAFDADLTKAMNRLRETPVPVLLAPAYGRHDEIPTIESGHPLLGWGVICAAIDTSLARSPLWPNGEGRSVDRCVADMIVAVGQLAAGNSPLSAAIERHRGGPLSAVQYVVGLRSQSDLDTALLSEFSGPASKELFSEEFVAIRVRPGKRDKAGICRLVIPVPDFGELARAAIHQATGPLASAHRVAPTQELAAITSSNTAAFLPDQGSSVHGVVVTSSTPPLELFAKAQEQGWWTVRYTDALTISRIFKSKFGNPELPTLPAELNMGDFQRLDGNRGIATRGIDTRDVVPLNLRQMDRWDTSPLDAPWPQNTLRPYRSAIGHVPPSEKTDRQIAYVAPALEVMKAIEEGDLMVKHLVEVSEWRGPRRSSGPWPKRLGDLEAAYAAAPSGLERFVIADGDLPVRIAALDDREVPAQNLFLIVGDASVPAVALSRAFHVWTFATITRSRGWPSRFTLARTFESFPLPTGLELVRVDRSLSALTASPSSYLAGSLRELEERLRQRQQWPQPYGSPMGRRLIDAEPLSELLDRPILGSYDLPPDATDLEILERLLAFNRNAAGHHRRG